MINQRLFPVLVVLGLNASATVLSLSGGFTPCRRLRQGHTVISLIQSGEKKVYDYDEK